MSAALLERPIRISKTFADDGFADDRVADEAPLISQDEFVQHLTEFGHAELVGGKIKIMPLTNYTHASITGNFYSALRDHVRQRKLGKVFVGDVGIHIKADKPTTRGADVAFISHERMAQVTSQVFLDVAPELIIEVISPGNEWNDVFEKINEYFETGALLVWIVEPMFKQVRIFTSSRHTTVVASDTNDTLTGGDVLPDFAVPVAELFD